MKTPIIWVAFAICSAIPLSAQQTGSSTSQSSAPDVAAMQQQIRDLQDRIIALEGQMRMLKSAQPTPAAPAETAAQPSAPAAPAVFAGVFLHLSVRRSGDLRSERGAGRW